MNTSELSGIELARMVAKAEGRDFSKSFRPDTNAAQAMEIVDREDIEIFNLPAGSGPGRCAFHRPTRTMMIGRDSFEAAMRCWVAAKFGERIEVEVTT